MTSDEQQYVVWMPNPDRPGWELPPATHGACTGGGHRILHELAVAIAATGRRVEVRGSFDLAELNMLSDAAGASPELPQESREPGARDVVVMPEGFDDPLTFGSVMLSGARAILLLLAPSGLFGWPFVGGWARQDPLEVRLDRVGLPQHYRAMAAMGFELWCNAPLLAEQIRAAGVAGTYVGAGRPVPFPDPLPKRYDVVTLANNRWAEHALAVVARLDGSVVHHEIPPGPNEDVLREFGRAKILVHPLRIEGDSRIGQEARGMGAVPVVLNTNPFRVGLDEEGGAVAVSSLEEMPAAITELLADPDRLAALRERGMREARKHLEWTSYVTRIDDVLSRPVDRDGAGEARALLRRSIIRREDSLRDRLHAEQARAADLEQSRATVRTELEAHVAELDQAKETIRVMQGTRVWRLGVWFWRMRTRFARLGRRAPVAGGRVDRPPGPDSTGLVASPRMDRLSERLRLRRTTETAVPGPQRPDESLAAEPVPGERPGSPEAPEAPGEQPRDLSRELRVGALGDENHPVSRLLYERLDRDDILRAQRQMLESPDFQNLSPATVDPATSRMLTLHAGMWHRIDQIAEKTGLRPDWPPDEVHAMARGALAAAGGLYEADLVAGALGSVGVEIARLERGLDFGCSSGRVVRVLSAAYPEVDWLGCDPNADAVTWAKEHLPGIEFFLSGDHPPLAVEARSLNLVFGISIWSHFEPELGLEWFEEMRRVLAPGGYLVMTTHGLTSVAHYAANGLRTREQCEEIADALYRRGWWYAPEFGDAGDWGVLNPGWGTAFLSPEWMLAELSPRWTVLEFAPGRNAGNQDVYVLQAT